MKSRLTFFYFIMLGLVFSISSQDAPVTVFLKQQDSKRFRNHLEQLTKAPHITASKNNEKVRDYIVNTMRNAGLAVEVFPYDIYLPVMPGTTFAEIVRPIRLPLNNHEYVHDEDPYSSHPDLGIGFNAYTGSGDVRGEVVYANYGRKEDFEQLEKMGISVKGKIVIARYGGNFRGYKAKFAEKYGAIGLIIFTDPADSGYMRGLVYPEGTYFDESTIQRGSLLTIDWTGDPLTPFDPALPVDGDIEINRLDPSEVKGLHTIPVMPLPYGSAKEIIMRMKGTPVPSGWQGGLPCTYRLQGGEDLIVRVNVQQERAIQRVYNVVGTLTGSELPDEWIIAGSHYDAWNFGSCDPNSGTAMLLSLSESLGALAHQGIRPRRTLKIAHWDAEETGIIGSTEWVEHLRDDLTAKAVAYLNADAAVSGKRFGGSASPTMKRVLMDATKKVIYPGTDQTVFAHWSGKESTPNIGNLGGGSDHLPFYAHLGIPSLNAGTGGPSLYHSNYDNLHFYHKFVDSSYQMGVMVEQVFGSMMLDISESEIIPYSLSKYGEDAKTHFETLQEIFSKLDKDKGGDFTFARLIIAAEGLSTTAALTESLLSKVNKSNVAAINQQLIALEREWLHPDGMPYGAWYRSLYVSSDPYSGYASWMMPAFHYEASIGRKSDLIKWELRYSDAMRKIENRLKEIMRLAK